eukprot:347016-Chlamydomonas_euryale.AAC.5
MEMCALRRHLLVQMDMCCHRSKSAIRNTMTDEPGFASGDEPGGVHVLARLTPIRAFGRPPAANTSQTTCQSMHRVSEEEDANLALPSSTAGCSSLTAAESWYGEASFWIQKSVPGRCGTRVPCSFAPSA